MAAAPGGKTTQMSALSNDKAMITACEKNNIRAERLKYNLNKQGVKRATVMLQDSRKLDDFFSFDKILLDAPCSGSGTINIQDEYIITKKLIENSSKIQEEMLIKALKILKPGKEMVYSTCSILEQENENILKKVLTKTNSKVIPINNIKGLPLLPVSIDGTICVMPNELYEGFFIAKIKKY
jgi:16S rRNA C967 or C1407 C5-methylase (RsmB/RsmF family)